LNFVAVFDTSDYVEYRTFGSAYICVVVGHDYLFNF